MSYKATGNFEENVNASLAEITKVLSGLVQRVECVESELKGLKSTAVAMNKKTPTKVKVPLIIRVSIQQLGIRVVGRGDGGIFLHWRGGGYFILCRGGMGGGHTVLRSIRAYIGPPKTLFLV